MFKKCFYRQEMNSNTVTGYYYYTCEAIIKKQLPKPLCTCIIALKQNSIYFQVAQKGPGC